MSLKSSLASLFQARISRLGWIFFAPSSSLPLSGLRSTAAPQPYCRRCNLEEPSFSFCCSPFPEALKVFLTTEMAPLTLPFCPVRFRGGSSEQPEHRWLARSSRLPASVHPLGIVRLGIGEHLVGPHQASSRAVVLSSDVPLPSCHLDYRGRRTPSGFSPTFTGSWHLAEGGFKPGTID